MTVANKPLCFLDTETTGLKPGYHEVIEIAIVRVDPASGAEDTLYTRIKPQHIDRADPIALRVNGYQPSEWAEAPTMSEIGNRIVEFLDGGILVGHNVAFDEFMIRADLESAGVPGKIPYHKVDTVTLAYEHLAQKGLESLSLDAIRRFLGWETEGAHRATKDVEDCRRLFDLLTRKLETL